MGSLKLPSTGTVYIDSQTLIYAIEQHTIYGRLLDPLWATAASGALDIVSSDLIVLETLVLPIRNNSTVLKAALFSSELQLLPIKHAVLLQSAKLRAIISTLRAPDAIHAATAILANCSAFFTNDLALRSVSQLPLSFWMSF